MKKIQTKTRPKVHQPLKRIQSGVQRLDYILKGGFIKGGTYSLIGPPGSGKTIFGNQLCFNHIQMEKGHCLYLTLLAESHAKMLSHIEQMEFFQPEVISQYLKYMSGYQVLRREGLKGLLDLIKKSIKDQKTTLLVIDGIQAAHNFSEKQMSFDEFIHQLQAYGHIMGCTTLLLAPSIQGRSDDTENVVVDGVMELSYSLIGPRAVRELTVHKFRGTDFLVGKHETEITNRGIIVHPRTEIQFDKPPGNADEKRIRMAFGIKKLDDMLNGGLMSGSCTVLLGAPGTGKTLLGLSFLVDGAMKGQKGIYYGFYETPPRLIEKAEMVGIPLRKFIKSGMIEILWQPPLEHYQDALAEKILEKVKEEKSSKRRLFIDGVEGFRAAAIYPERMPRFLSAFFNQLRMSDVTTVISEELDLFKSEVNMPNPELASVSEGVILVRYVEVSSQIHRLISILKMRESAYDTSIREFTITSKGIGVSDSFKSAENILSGKGELLSGRGKVIKERK